MRDRTAKIATIGAALTVTSFFVGLTNKILPLFLWNAATAALCTIFVVCSAFLLVTFYVVVLSVIGIVCLVGNPVGLLLILTLLLTNRIRTRTQTIR
ncbi:MAG TPA: hypothetical protein EYM95_23590 [Candidatus Obscuribacterales bacterium]|jgi:hypothetical protein|nr:hypothetical protein [Candidatus Obscuribacterales bacterium]